jgi:hypothetical protein
MASPTSLASWFLLIAGIAFLAAFALPLILSPLGWARVFKWKLPEETKLTLYFGRCLGATALAIVLLCFRAVPDPAAHLELFDLIILVCGGVTGVHVYGALRKLQPWTEDVEIVLYAAITALAVWLRLQLS